MNAWSPLWQGVFWPCLDYGVAAWADYFWRSWVAHWCNGASPVAAPFTAPSTWVPPAIRSAERALRQRDVVLPAKSPRGNLLSTPAQRFSAANHLLIGLQWSPQTLSMKHPKNRSLQAMLLRGRLGSDGPE